MPSVDETKCQSRHASGFSRKPSSSMNSPLKRFDDLLRCPSRPRHLRRLLLHGHRGHDDSEEQAPRPVARLLRLHERSGNPFNRATSRTNCLDPLHSLLLHLLGHHGPRPLLCHHGHGQVSFSSSTFFRQSSVSARIGQTHPARSVPQRGLLRRLLLLPLGSSPCLSLPQGNAQDSIQDASSFHLDSLLCPSLSPVRPLP